MSDVTATTHTRYGTIGGSGIVLRTPLDLPEGTEVVVDVRVAGEPRVDAAGAEDEVPTSLTPEQLHEWVLAHPAPQSWWDETDNPFEPEQPEHPHPEAGERQAST